MEDDDAAFALAAEVVSSTLPTELEEDAPEPVALSDVGTSELVNGFASVVFASMDLGSVGFVLVDFALVLVDFAKLVVLVLVSTADDLAMVSVCPRPARAGAEAEANAASALRCLADSAFVCFAVFIAASFAASRALAFATFVAVEFLDFAFALVDALRGGIETMCERVKLEVDGWWLAEKRE